MHLEHILGKIQADDANLCHGRFPLSDVYNTRYLGTLMPSGGVHPIAHEAFNSNAVLMIRLGIALQNGIDPSPFLRSSRLQIYSDSLKAGKIACHAGVLGFYGENDSPRLSMSC